MQAALGWKHRLTALLTLLVCACGIGSARAQVARTSDLPYQQRFLTEQLRPLIAPSYLQDAGGQRFVSDYGAVARYSGLWLEDPGDKTLGDFQASRGAHLWEIRPWYRASYDQVHHGYIRGQYGFLQYEKGDSFIRNSEWQGPFVDIGFYRFDVDEALRRYRGEVVERWALDATVGRQFLFLGRGIAFALTTDAVVLDGAKGEWGGTFFTSRSVPHYDNIDISAPSFERSDRRFIGGQLEFQGFDRHEFYGFAMAQNDHSGEVLRVVGPGGNPTTVQRFDYDSEYFGIGATGELLFGPPEDPHGVPNLEYYTEFIVQTGESYGEMQTQDRDAIRAWAADVGLTYHWNTPQLPRVGIEYAYASGDPDRLVPQSTRFGNQVGTKDTGFLGFGYINTGVSYAPLLSNLQFLRVGGSFRPFERSCQPCYSTWLRHMQLGTNAFVYWRPRSQGGTSDIRNDIPGSNFLGAEWDFHVSWRLSSDLYLLTNYGIFVPNDESFSVSSGRQFVSWSLNWLL